MNDVINGGDVKLKGGEIKRGADCRTLIVIYEAPGESIAGQKLKKK